MYTHIHYKFHPLMPTTSALQSVFFIDWTDKIDLQPGPDQTD